MPEYRGTLTGIETKATDKGPYRRIAVGKAHFNVFDGTVKLEPLLNHEVVVEYTEKENPGGKPFWNFAGIKEAPADAPSPSGNGRRDPEMNASIERQVCLKCAVDVEIAAHSEGGLRAEHVLDSATKFWQWMQGNGSVSPDGEKAGQGASVPEKAQTPGKQGSTRTQAAKPAGDAQAAMRFWEWTRSGGRDLSQEAVYNILSGLPGGQKITTMDDWYKSGHTIEGAYEAVRLFGESELGWTPELAEMEV